MIKQFTEHPGVIPTLLSDGQQMLIPSRSGLILLDIDTGKEIKRIEIEFVPVDHSKESLLESLGAARYLVSSDERYAVTLSNPLAQWDLTDGSILSYRIASRRQSDCGAWSEDGKRFAAGYSTARSNCGTPRRLTFSGSGPDTGDQLPPWLSGRTEVV